MTAGQGGSCILLAASIYCTVLYCTVLYCTVLYCTVLYCTVLFNLPFDCSVEEKVCDRQYDEGEKAHHEEVGQEDVVPG